MACVKFAHSQPGFSGQGDVGGYGCRVLIHYPLETFQGFGDFSQSQVELATIYVENKASFGVLALDELSRFTKGDLGGIVVSGIQVPYASILPKVEPKE